MSYTLTDISDVDYTLSDGINTYTYRKCYSSVELQGEYIVLTSHKVENNAFRQQWSIGYTDFTSPTGTASAVYNAIKTIIENYAGGGAGGFVPYTGATGDVDLGTHGLSTDFVEFSLTPTASPGTGQIAYNGATGSLAYLMNSSTVQSEIGQTMHAYVHNAEAVTITKGQAVYLYQASGNKASVKLAYNTSDATSAKTFGLAAENISAGQKGFVMCQGSLDGLNTGAYTVGDTLYLGATAGTITNVKPYAPNHLVYVGIVERANAGNGQIYVRTQNGYELDELHNVQAQSPSNNDVLYYDSASSQWKTTSIATILGYTPVAGNSAITGATKTKITYDSKGLVTAGADATTADIADSTNKRYVTDAQLVVIGNTSGTNTGDQTLSGLGGVATTRTISTTTPLSGGGDLSANRTLSIADAVADGTTKGAATFTASDFNSASGVISLDYTNGQAASASNKGFLTSADWTTFNNRLLGYGQYRKAGRWYNNGIFPPANASFTNQINIRYVPLWIDYDVTITRLGLNVTTAAAAGNTARIGIYSNDATTTQPLSLLVDSGTYGTLALDSTGAKSVTGLSLALTKGLYWMAYTASIASGTITGIGTNFMFDVKGQAAISGVGWAGFNQTFVYGALPASAGTLADTGGTGTVCLFYYF